MGLHQTYGSNGFQKQKGGDHEGLGIANMGYSSTQQHLRYHVSSSHLAYPSSTCLAIVHCFFPVLCELGKALALPCTLFFIELISMYPHLWQRIQISAMPYPHISLLLTMSVSIIVCAVEHPQEVYKKKQLVNNQFPCGWVNY